MFDPFLCPFALQGFRCFKARTSTGCEENLLLAPSINDQQPKTKAPGFHKMLTTQSGPLFGVRQPTLCFSGVFSALHQGASLCGMEGDLCRLLSPNGSFKSMPRGSLDTF